MTLGKINKELTGEESVQVVLINKDDKTFIRIKGNQKMKRFVNRNFITNEFLDDFIKALKLATKPVQTTVKKLIAATDKLKVLK